jgi:hypothetical protein
MYLYEAHQHCASLVDVSLHSAMFASEVNFPCASDAVVSTSMSGEGHVLAHVASMRAGVLLAGPGRSWSRRRLLVCS